MRRLCLLTAACGLLALAWTGLALASPPDPNAVGSTTLSSIEVNGASTTVATVAPGADVTIQANWSDSHPSYCPGCIDFVSVGYSGSGFAGCIEDFGFSGESGSGTVDLGPAPTTPGVYDIVGHFEFVYNCGDSWSAPASSGYPVIAQIVVPAPQGPGRGAYCAGAGNTDPATGAAIAPGAFLNLQYGQAQTDSHYAGATWAVYGQGYGLTCDNMPGLGYHDSGLKVDDTGTHTGTAADVYEYYVESS